MTSLFAIAAKPTTKTSSHAMRDYQTRAVDSIGRCLAEHGSTLLVCPTGSGKTVMLAHAIAQHSGGKRALVIAHRRELIEQNARTIEAVLGEPCSIEMADRHADLGGMGKARVIVASKDSLHPKRLCRLNPAEFGLIVSDECVPAGTLVDGRPIETLITGDMVGCLNPAADWIPVLRRITHTFKHKPNRMVRITLDDGTMICGTTNHPVWIDSQRRWKNAGDVTRGDVVSRLTTYGHKELYRLRQELHASSAQDRREIAPDAFPSWAGRKENRFLERARVDRVEILERGSDGTFGGVCPDGLVYNLEVEEHNTYFANGVVVHNCHHSVADSYQRIYDYFAGVPHLGLTATPDRADEEALGQVYNSVAMVYEIADAIDDGWLVPVHAHTVIVKGLELADISTTAGDLNQGELAQQMEHERVMHEIAASVTAECGDRRAIVFTVSVRQAEMLSEILNDYAASRWVCGETPREIRNQTLIDHKRGEYQFLVNCGVLLEGYDDPGCSVIVSARPTKSRSLFAQMLGRGTRPLPGLVDGVPTAAERRAAIAASEKPWMTCLDFTGNCGRHKLINPADVLGGKYPQEDRDAAALALQDGGDVNEALERARQAREESGSKEDIAAFISSRAKITALSRHILTDEQLFDGPFTPGRERTWFAGKGPTDPQIETLEKAGFGRDDVARMSRVECSRLIGEIIARRTQGLCTAKQAKFLASRGLDARKMPFAEASKRIGKLMQGWRR